MKLTVEFTDAQIFEINHELKVSQDHYDKISRGQGHSFPDAFRILKARRALGLSMEKADCVHDLDESQLADLRYKRLTSFATDR